MSLVHPSVSTPNFLMPNLNRLHSSGTNRRRSFRATFVSAGHDVPDGPPQHFGRLVAVPRRGGDPALEAAEGPRGALPPLAAGAGLVGRPAGGGAQEKRASRGGCTGTSGTGSIAG